MKLNLGSKEGKNNRRLLFLNKKRKRRLDEIEKEEYKKKIDVVKKEKEKRVILEQPKKEQVNLGIIRKVGKKKPEIIKPVDIDIKDNISKKVEKDNIVNNDVKKEPLVDKKVIIDTSTPVLKIVSRKKVNVVKSDEVKEEKRKQVDSDYLEKQIIKILDHQIDENNYRLKKLDSEMYAIEKEIDDLKEKEDTREILREIEFLIEKLKEIKKQIVSLQQTFDFDFPIDDPDNYLIYLVDEFKEKRKNCQLLSDKLKESKEYKNIVDRIIEIELRQEELLDKLKEKESQLELDDEEVAKLNDAVINIEDMKSKIDEMIKNQTSLLEEVRSRVNETVHITERVEYISKSVKHSLFDLFLLMAMLKHNLSIKNSVVAAVSAKIALDLIMKMTTPVTEKVVTMVSDVSDYSDMINGCLNDTAQLESIMDENLSNVSSLLYTFEHDYKDCAYLDSYQEALSKIISLESELKERKMEVIKIKEETALQLEKNEAKVKKYGSMAA